MLHTCFKEYKGLVKYWLTFSYYMSNNVTTHESKDMVSGNFSAGARNEYLTYSDWGWAFDTVEEMKEKVRNVRGLRAFYALTNQVFIVKYIDLYVLALKYVIYMLTKEELNRKIKKDIEILEIEERMR